MANMSIARRISDTFPEGAMLRRHPPPKQVSIEELVCAFKQTANHACMHAYTYVMYVRTYVQVKRCAVLGLKLDISTASSIQVLTYV